MNHRRREVSEPKKRELEVMIISAEDLKNVKRIGKKMRCYAVAYMDPDHKASTSIDQEGVINPTWNEKLLLTTDDELLSNVLAAITVEIYSYSHIRDRLVGTARILISELLTGGDPAKPSDNPIQCLAVQVRRPSGRPQGILNIWVPPTGKFLLHRASLSFSRRDAAGVTPLEHIAHNGDGAAKENEKQITHNGGGAAKENEKGNGGEEIHPHSSPEWSSSSDASPTRSPSHPASGIRPQENRVSFSPTKQDE